MKVCFLQLLRIIITVIMETMDKDGQTALKKPVAIDELVKQMISILQ